LTGVIGSRETAGRSASGSKESALKDQPTPSAIDQTLRARLSRAASLVNQSRLLDALDEIELCLRLAPREEAVRRGAADILTRLRRPHEALAHVKAVAAMKGGVLELAELAKTLDAVGEHQEALAAYRQALSRSPVKAPICVLMSTSALSHGDRGEAERFLMTALKADPHDGYTHLSLATHFPERCRIDAVEQALQATAQRPKQLHAAPLQFALGRLKDRAGDVDGAFAAFEAGNGIMAELAAKRAAGPTPLPWADSAGPPPSSGPQACAQPVFVFGMPRSGTTLVEQVIASHPMAAGIGELELVPRLIGSLGGGDAGAAGRCSEAYLAAYPPRLRQAARVVDKSLSSWLYLPAIRRLFPKARFICCRRHPMDLCWSAYTELFAEHALTYTYRLDTLAERCRLHDAAMIEARRHMGGDLLDIRYEELVDDPEPVVRRLLSFCGLPFDAACLRPDLTRGAIRTASRGQVRQPIYRSSVGRWRPYAGHLARLQRQLAAAIAAYEGQAP
jgi:Tfp pilus assembly protein PilF